MLRAAWRDVRFHPVRFAMSVLAVALGVAFVSGTFALRAMLSSTFDGIVDSTLDGDAYVLPDDGSTYMPPWMSEVNTDGMVADSLVPLITPLDEVAVAFADYTGPVLLVGADGTRVSSGGAPSMGLVVDDAASRDQWFEITGVAPRGEGQIALEHLTAQKAGLGIGDTTTVVVAGQAPREVVVTAIVSSTNGTPFAGAVVVGMDEETARAAYAPTGAVGTIVVRGAPGTSQGDLARAVAAVLPPEANATVKTGDTLRAEARESINAELGFVSMFLMVFAVIALFVGGFIIANTFAMVVRQRLRETAVLRAVGASRRQVFASFVAQAAIVGLLGSVVGVGAGFGLVAIIRQVFAAIGMALSGAVPVTVSGLVVPVTVGVVVSMVAAALPARRASRTAPVEAMRPDSQDTQRSTWLRGTLGSVMTLAGVGCLVGAHRAGDSGGPLLGAAAGLILVGLVVAAPALAPTVVRVLAAPVAAVSKPFGTLASRNLARNRRRTASTAAALMIGMALVGATTVLASSARASVDDLIGTQIDADLLLDGNASASGIPAAAVDALADVDDAEVAMVSIAFGTIQPAGGSASDLIQVGVMNPTLITRGAFVPTIISGDLASFDEGIAVSEPVAKRMGIAFGDQVTVTLARNTPLETTTVLPVQLVYTTKGTSEDVVVAEQTMRSLFGPDAYAQVVTTWQGYVIVDPGADPAAVRAQVVDIVAPYMVVSVMDAEEFASYLSNQVQDLLKIIYALIALSLVIAVLGVINTLALSVLERTSEIGMMRAVGMGRGQLGWTMVVEGVLVASLGAVLGVSAGVGIASVIPSIAESVGLGVLSISWPSVVSLFAGAVVVGVLAALWPAARAARVPVLQALVYE
ncbi:MAG: FtsX-like permease family protein [Micrococcales bacterium]|nr:FtsX-like permease family protein [Micrococcales bacterium]MCL2668492.1 FtsX-like permease family protein [Micrococcales bacterium]